MPTAPLRPCATPRCPELVSSGHCAIHRRSVDRRRGTSHERGYTTAGWGRFRAQFISLLIQAGLAPACGVSLPGGPPTARYSRCLADGIHNGVDLELDHDPPLSEAERIAATRGDRRAFDDPLRVGLLCRSCHSAKGDNTFGRVHSGESL